MLIYLCLTLAHIFVQMLAELKDLVQKGLFTQVCPITVDFGSHIHAPASKKLNRL